MKYQVVYQGYEPEPNQVVSDPLSLEDASLLACELQGETGKDPTDNKKTDFYVVEPIFTEVK
jgi:hypothetical protein